jgi:hypothetical protein|eukprot:COSAG01_NODE_1785_length_9235_cov_6.629816_2_plen_119_part_00
MSNVSADQSGGEEQHGQAAPDEGVAAGGDEQERRGADADVSSGVQGSVIRGSAVDVAAQAGTAVVDVLSAGLEGGSRALAFLQQGAVVNYTGDEFHDAEVCPPLCQRHFVIKTARTCY